MTSPWTLGWQRAVAACHRTMHAAYGVVHMVEDDVDTLTKLLAGLGEEADQVQNTQSSYYTKIELRHRDFVIPEIVVSPPPDIGGEVSCWVPCQDAAFGARLVVPEHPTVNDVHPPLVPPTRKNHWASTWPERRWKWQAGHWRIVLPSPEEQMRRGMFSRAQRKARRTRKPW